jgi:hypothetical protein
MKTKDLLASDLDSRAVVDSTWTPQNWPQLTAYQDLNLLLRARSKAPSQVRSRMWRQHWSPIQESVPRQI